MEGSGLGEGGPSDVWGEAQQGEGVEPTAGLELPLPPGGGGAGLAAFAGDAHDADAPLARSPSLPPGRAPARRAGVVVYAFGRDDLGQLGLGGDADADMAEGGGGGDGPAPPPRRVDALDGRDIVGLAAGDFHSAAVTADGELYVWGLNEAGQCAVGGGGGGGAAVVRAPARVAGLESHAVAAAACGGAHTLAALDGGGAAAFGDAAFGALGAGGAGGGPRPRLVPALKAARLGRVAAGGAHSVALGAGAAGGCVWTWGDDASGALGLDGDAPAGAGAGAGAPRLLPRLWPLGVVQVACGGHHTAFLAVGGALYTCGRNKYGALGVGTREPARAPARVAALAGAGVVQVACGGDHTVALVAAGGGGGGPGEGGEVYAWGRGHAGQHGHGHADVVTYPRRVGGALAGVRCAQVAAGAAHTLALAARGGARGAPQLWGFGDNSDGALGAGGRAPRLAPAPVEGLPPGCEVLFVAAGGGHSLAACAAPGGAAAEPAAPPLGWAHAPLPPPGLLPALRRAAAAVGEGAGAPAPEQAELLQHAAAAVEATFACPAFVLHELSEGPPPPPGSAGGAPAPSAALVGEAFELVVRLARHEPGVAGALGAGAVRLLDRVEAAAAAASAAAPPGAAAAAAAAGAARTPEELARLPLAPDLAWAPPLLAVLLQSPLLGEPRFGPPALARAARLLASALPADARVPVRRGLQAALGAAPPGALLATVRAAQKYLASLVARAGPAGVAAGGAARLEVLMAGVLLDVLRQASEDGGGGPNTPIVPAAEFYSPALSDAANLGAEYSLWDAARQRAPAALASLIQMPYLLTPLAKARLLRGEAAARQHAASSSAAVAAFLGGAGDPAGAACLRLVVRRAHVVADALAALAAAGAAGDLGKPLRVTFVSAGGVPEEAEDAGGVTKEFFQICVRDLFRADHGMFEFSDETRTHWFRVGGLLEGDDAGEYGLVGALLGLAIYNGVVLDVRFPRVLYEKLLGGAGAALADVEAAFPALGRGLRALAEYEPAAEVEAVFCRAFEAGYEAFGEARTAELVPGGSKIAVTGDNRGEYVGRYARWVLHDSVAREFGAFAAGFLSVCGTPLLRALLTPAELELLVCGTPHLDFGALRAAARYEGGFSPDTTAIGWFWDVVTSWPPALKRALLAFATGCDRAPVGGLGELSLLVQRAGPDTDRLPTAHTCFNALLLPEYATRERLEARLRLAVENATGFGLR